MVRTRHGRVRLTDLLYGCSVLLATGLAPRDSGLDLVIVCFALLVLVVDWRDIRGADDPADSPHGHGVARLALIVPVLGVWVGLVTVGSQTLELFFALLAGFFVLAAVRDALVFDLTPVDILLDGYPSLVAVYLALGATADAIEGYETLLVLLAVGVYVVRNVFYWTSAALGWLVGDDSLEQG